MRQFTVKIDSSSEGNGSGVIIAKEGNIYTVLTADHLLCEKPIPGVLNQPCFDYTYSITTHDGKTYPINKSTIIRQEGVDLAVFKFESPESYPLAEIANYNPNKNDHVFVAGFPKIGDKATKWMFSGGLVYDKEEGLLKTRQADYTTTQSGSLQSSSSLTGGYELVYTSITYGGMTGGPVLDAAGKVIGIHGRAEGVANNTIIHLGYSLGIPISTFVGLRDKFTVNLPSITTLRPQISVKQSWDLFKAIINVKVPDTNATADIWIERGGQLWRLFRYSDAIKDFDEAIKQNNPDNVYLAWYGKGLALADNGQIKAAIEALQQAINTLPTGGDLKEFHGSILLRQSVLYSYLQDYEKALNAINKALYLSPDNPNWYNEKYQILSKLKRYDEALEAINNAINLAPRAIWYVNRGNLYKNQQKWDLALADYTKAIDINPNYANAYYNRALLYTDLQKWDLAETDYNKAIALNPNLAAAYYNRVNF